MVNSASELTQIVLFVMLSVIVVLFFGLSNLESDIEFRSVVIFTLTFLGSFYTLLFLSVTPIGNRISGKNVRLFFFHPLELRVSTILYILLGIGGAFGFSAFANFASFDPTTARLVAIGGAGFVFLFLLFKTRTILIPILAHGAFNSLVIVLRSNTWTSELLSSNPFPVPEIGITLGSLNTIASESLFQFILVAPAEEFFKVLLISFIFLSIKGRFDSKGVTAYLIAGSFSVILWMVFHLIRGGTTV